jgi:hypothetical protein
MAHPIHVVERGEEVFRAEVGLSSAMNRVGGAGAPSCNGAVAASTASWTSVIDEPDAGIPTPSSAFRS